MLGFRPSRRLTSKALCNALRAFVVPVVTKLYSVICLRALCDAYKNEESLAEEMIPVKRRQFEMLLGKISEVLIIFALRGWKR